MAASAGEEGWPDLELLLETGAGADHARGRSSGEGRALPTGHVAGGSRAEELRTRGPAVAALRNPSEGYRVSEGEERGSSERAVWCSPDFFCAWGLRACQWHF